MTDLISFVQSTAGSTSNTAGSAATLAENFDTFLTLLTAQMQNQDPLEPLDASEFTNQLVQFSGVEQQIQSNEALNTLIASNQSTAGAALSGYLGQLAEIDSAGAGFYGDDVTWNYRLGSDATKATLSISDSKGEVVWSQDAELTAGEHAFTWDGTMLDGETAATDNVYYASVTATNADGDSVPTGVGLLARVTGIDLSYGEPALATTAGIYGYSDLLRVSQN